MFQSTQGPSSGSSLVLSWNYGFMCTSVELDVVRFNLILHILLNHIAALVLSSFSLVFL